LQSPGGGANVSKNQIDVSNIEVKGNNDKEKFKFIISDITANKINITISRKDNLHIRDFLINKYGEEGLNYYLQIRANKKSFDKDKEIKEYQKDMESGKRYNFDLGSVIRLYKQAKAKTILQSS
jgi:hypothetical protein